MEADKLPGIIMGTAVLEKNCLLMFWSYQLSHQAAVYGDENNEIKVSRGTHQWEDEYYSLTS